MSAKQKSQRGFVAVTLITLLALALVVIVYATLLGTFTGDTVGVVTLNGSLKYNEDNSTIWNTTLSGVANGSSWYVMFNTTEAGYAGDVNITWTLQELNGAWADVSPSVNQTTNDFTLDGNAEQEIYASGSGLQEDVKDWGTGTSTAGTYRIKMEVITA